jgi:D-sedoheptulose 7-phosphate isomerase
MMAFYSSYYDELRARLDDAPAAALEQLCELLMTTRQRGRKVIVAGNGGSAAMASHVSVDLTKAAKIRATCFNESDLITCYANDYGYADWIAQALRSYADAGDVAVLISSRGESANIINGARAAKELGLAVVTLSGFDAANSLRTLGDLNLWVNSSAYNVVEITHQSWLLACVDRLTVGDSNK